MMFSKTTRAVLAPVFLIAFTFSGTALACSTTGWDDEDGMVAVGQPFGAAKPDLDGVSRFEELCALVAVDTGWVQTNTPSHTEVRNRFYVLPALSGGGVEGASGADILVGYSDNDALTTLFNIGFDGTEFTFNVVGGGNATSPAQPGWNWIEYHWDGVTFEYWVNADATSEQPTNSFPAAGGTLEAVRLGLPNGLAGLSGMVGADSFEMHHTTAVGPLPNCDANGDTDFNVFDLLAAIDEINEFGLATGTPDCDFSGGALNVFDLLAMIDVINAQ